jgi:hypothetical protein
VFGAFWLITSKSASAHRAWMNQKKALRKYWPKREVSSDYQFTTDYQRI